MNNAIELSGDEPVEVAFAYDLAEWFREWAEDKMWRHPAGLSVKLAATVWSQKESV